MGSKVVLFQYTKKENVCVYRNFQLKILRITCLLNASKASKTPSLAKISKEQIIL